MVCSDPVELLCKLLESALDQRYQLATQYIKAFNLDSEMVMLVVIVVVVVMMVVVVLLVMMVVVVLLVMMVVMGSC